jgi:TfoX/Sxy family transcriptional regulator of competence genes
LAYDEAVARRVRAILTARPGVDEKRMFGGLAFLICGHMCCGILGDELMVRVGPAAYEAALKQPHARPMDFTGRPLRGFVYVAPAGFDSKGSLEAWVARGAEFVASLPAKGRRKARN